VYQALDQILNAPVRLAVVSILMKVEKADFVYLKDRTQTTQGNLSHQIKKLKEAGYVRVKKSFQNNYPKTELSLTPKGKDAFEKYVEQMKKFLHLEK